MGAGPLELIAEARAGRAEALGELCSLYRNYMRMVVRTGLGPKLRERVELSDVVQEALVEVVRQFPQFTGQNEAALVGWLRRLVGQKLADLGRYHSRAKRSAGRPTCRSTRRLTTARPTQAAAGGKLLDMLALSQTSPSEAASRRELTVLLADAVAGLPEQEAEVLWLYHADGLSFEAIGDRLGVSRKSIRGIYARGLRDLKRMFDAPGIEARGGDPMVRPASETGAEAAADRDERLGEAIEDYLALAESGQAPEAQAFASRYPDLEEDLLAAIEGLALVRGLVGEPCGPGHRLESGHRVAGYRIVRELGRGGMGIVYEAVHVGLDRPVALKVLGSSAAPDSSGRRRFLNEARTAAGLHHTHIVPVFDVGQVGGLCYYAMQRIEGAGLDRVIKHLRRDRSTAAGSTYPRTRAVGPNGRGDA